MRHTFPIVTVVYSDGVAFKFFPTAQQPYSDVAVTQRAFFLRSLALGSIADVSAVLRFQPLPRIAV